ncbi:MAG: YibE/F family protein, partial [Firmicutes bacterium]|nr:YibE/F family protein [Bacillota bacterium]
EITSTQELDNGQDVYFQAVLLNSEQKGETIEGYQRVYTNYYPVQEPVKAGDRIMVYEVEGKKAPWVMQEYLRFNYITGLGILFCLGVLLFGRFKGLNTLISLLFTCLAIFAVYIPSILSGQSIYLWTIIVCLYIIVMTMLLINGLDRKSLCAGLGCFSGVLVAGLITFIMSRMMNLTGMATEDTLYLTMLELEKPIDLRAIIFGTITIGALGAVMDVAMDISTSLNEIRQHDPQVGRRELLKSGFNIGRDVMGTMANTLVLAYIGCDLATTLLLAAYNVGTMELLNMELLINEFLDALAGSFGILMTLPLTSFICSLVYVKKKKEQPPVYY